MQNFVRIAVILGFVLESCLALSCYDCDGQPEFCPKKVTLGSIYNKQQQADARCMVVYGDGQLYVRR